MAGLVGGHVERAVGDALGALDRLELPLAVLAVPLIGGLDLEQLVLQARLRHGLAVGRHHDHVEIGIGAVGERAAVEIRLDADHAAPPGVTGSVSVRSTARPPDSAMLMVILACSGRVVLGTLSRATAKLALPSSSVVGQVAELLAQRRDLVIGDAEIIAGKARALLGGADRHRAVERRGRRPARHRGNGRRRLTCAGVCGEIAVAVEVRSNSMRSGT